MALKLEGITRNTGKHAGGVVIAPEKLPITRQSYAMPMVQTALHNTIKMTLRQPVWSNSTFGLAKPDRN